MPPALKQELGLDDPKPKASTEQSDKFKAAFQAAAAVINECLQYTAAHAEQAKHDPQASKRDTSCQAYQVALGRIDPTNPSVAQGAIDQVIAGVGALKSTIETLKTAVEKAFNEWTGKKPDLDDATDKIREMVEWGQEKASALQQVIEGIVGKANERAYEQATKALGELVGKLKPLYDEYIKQKAAQAAYEPALQALQPRLDQTKTCTFKSLADLQQGIDAASQQMQDAAAKKDYVTALAQEQTLEGKVGEFEQKIAELEAKKQEYETARAAVDPKIEESAQCPFKSLAEMDQKINELKEKTDSAASEEKYDEALQSVNELSAAVDEKIAKAQELEAKKAEYDTANAQAGPKADEALQCPYKSLADQDQKISDLKSKADSAATEEKYDEALQSVNDLTTACDEKLARAQELEAKKAEYDTARAALDPKLAEASNCQFESLAELDQQIADLTTQTDAAAGEEKYDEAVQLVTDLGAKVDEKLQKVKELEEKKKQYEDARAALDSKLKEASSSKYEELADLDQKVADLTTQTDAAAEKQDYDTAIKLVGDLSAAVDEKLAKQADIDAYKTARAAVDPKIQQAAYCSKHEELTKIEAEIEDLKAQLDKAVAAKDFKTATTLCGTLSGKIDTKLSEQGRLDRKIVGSAQKERADTKLEAMDEDTRKRYNALADAAKSPEELDYLTKAMSSGYKIEDLEAFAKKINGKDKDWLQNNLKLTGDTSGKGVQQQWSYSCNATTTEAIRGELDPVYALKLHEENKDLTSVDENDATKVNPKLAEEQKKWLESEYSGSAGAKHKGVATSIKDPDGKGSGRWADDLMNNMSDVTGLEYSNKKISGSYKVDDAVTDIEKGLKQGNPVPIVVGASDSDYSHYVLVTGRSEGPPPTWTIHDVGSGKTITRTVQDVKDGKLGIGSYNKISALDNPSVKKPTK